MSVIEEKKNLHKKGKIHWLFEKLIFRTSGHDCRILAAMTSIGEQRTHV
jgi:hypothetical protein